MFVCVSPKHHCKPLAIATFAVRKFDAFDIPNTSVDVLGRAAFTGFRMAAAVHACVFERVAWPCLSPMGPTRVRTVWVLC